MTSPSLPRERPALLGPIRARGERPALTLRRGSGMHVELEDGRTVLDVGSLSSCILGHCHPEVVAAVREAAGQVYVTESTGYAPRERAAEDLLRIAFAGEPWAESVVFFVSSSEAADLGLLLAQTLTGREPLVSRELAYHGATGLGRDVSTHPLFGAALASPTGGSTPRHACTPTRRLPLPDCGRRRLGPEHVCAESCLRSAAELLDGAAAVITDYSQGGLIPSPQYQDTLASAARAAGALSIADETVTAFGRLGHGFAFQRGASRPDMVTLGKGITAGAVAGGALVLSREVVERIDGRRWMTSSTYRGNPLTVAAISAVMRVLERERLADRAATLGAKLGADLERVVERHPSAKRVIGEGMLWLIELASAPEHAEGAWCGDGTQAPLTDVVQRAALERGVLIGAYSGQTIWLVPPLIAEAEQLEQAVEALDEALDEADRELERRQP
ncbi:MAG TPA: aminotransferase class III-fold pyridoxal phosphate-dependent enzyme [Conexibacter sp.]|nr:aminotransferase class III-fold pyridoxal phosphate-dependent enzyme [Conexibacter sp.]